MSPRTPTSLRVKVGLLLTASLLALLIGEVILRNVPHAAPLVNLDIYEKSPEGQLRLRAGVERRHVTRHWDVTVSINGEGRRDRSLAPREGAKVVLVLGDSFAFGWGVEFEDSMPALLEEQAAARVPVQVLNASVPGTGTGDHWERLRSEWENYRPDVVLLVFFVGNDFTDVQFGGSRQFDVEDGLLVRRSLSEGDSGSATRSLRRYLVRKSRLLQLAAGAWWRWSRGSGEKGGSAQPRYWDEWMREFAKVHLRRYPKVTAQAVDRTLDFLTQISEFCRRKSARFLLAIVPRSYQVYPDEAEELKEALGLRDEDLDLDKPQRILRQWAQEANVAAVDLLPVFRRYQESGRGPRLYYSPDAHLTSHGHRLAAKAIYPVLLQALETSPLDADRDPE